MFAVIALAITWSSVSQISLNYRLERQVQEKIAENELLSQQVLNNQLENEYLQTDYFKELELRRQLGLIKEGESVLLISQKQLDELVSSVELPTQTEPDATIVVQKSNLHKWFDFFTGQKVDN